MARPAKYKNGAPSVTTLVGMINPFNPTWWFKAKRKELIRQGLDLNTHDAIEVCDQIKRDSQVIGHKVHKGIEEFLSGKTFDEASEGMTNNQCVMLSYLTDWCSKTKIRPIALEEVLYYECPKHKDTPDSSCLECHKLFGGTPDAIATFDDGKTLSVIDWKTSNLVTSQKQNLIKYKLQLTGYALAYERTYGVPVKDGHVVWASKDLKFLHIPIKITKADRQQFIELRGLYRYIKGK